MNRRSLLTASLLLVVPATARASTARAPTGGASAGGAALPSEVRAAVPAATARRMAARLGVPVRPAGQEAVMGLHRGHLELALLDGVELARARTLMGDRLLELRPSGTGALVTRRALSPALRAELAAAVA